MSGGGGSGGSGFDLGQGKSEISCYSIVQTCHVSSPDPEIIRQIAKNDVLDVVVDQTSTPLLLVKKPDGQILGSVVPPLMARIVSCIIEQGVDYMAVVLDIQGGMVQVQIRAKA